MAVPPRGKVVTLLMLLKLLYITAIRIFWTQKMRCMQTLLHYKFKIHTLNTSSLQHWTILYFLQQLAFLFEYQWTWLNLCLPYLLKKYGYFITFCINEKMHWFSQRAYHKDGCNHEQFLKNSAEVLVVYCLFVCDWKRPLFYLLIFFVNKFSRQNFKPYEWNIWEIKFFSKAISTSII